MLPSLMAPLHGIFSKTASQLWTNDTIQLPKIVAGLTLSGQNFI